MLYLGGVIILGVVVYAGLSAVGVLPSSGPSDVDKMGTETCEETFGDEWSYQGHAMVSNPPVLSCSGPNGQTGIVEMPSEMQDELNIVTAENVTIRFVGQDATEGEN